MSAYFKKIIWGLVALILLSGCDAFTPASNQATSLPAPKIEMEPFSCTDHDIFRQGLVQAFQDDLGGLKGASIYNIGMYIAEDYASIYGHETVCYTNLEESALDSVHFRLFPNLAEGKMNVSAVKINDQAVEPVSESVGGAMSLPLAIPLPPGQQLMIDMDFEVQMPRELGGNYGLLGKADDILVMSEVYPVIPVYDAAGWHDGVIPQNADIAFFDASFYIANVTAPSDLVIASTGIETTHKDDGNWRKHTFVAGPVREFYMAASKLFTVTSTKVGETTINNYALAERSDGARVALDVAKNALKSYNDRYDVYPYTEFDMVSIPLGALGIEYPGVTGMNMEMYDLNAEIAGLSARVMLESVIAHEIAHQWFYNLVGSDQINEPWLDEAVTQFATGLYYRDIYGQQGERSYRSSWETRWERVNKAAIPIGKPAGDYSTDQYSPIVYGRGPLFVSALEEKLGKDKFAEFERDYVESNRWSIATTASFKALAEKHCQCDLTPLFDAWVTAPASP